MTLTRILASTALATGLMAAPVLAAEECGDVSIAEMNWASAGLAAWVDKIILEEGYGCNVELVTGDTMPTFTSMNEKGEPDIAPELWLNAVQEPLEAAVDEGRLIIASQILADGGVEGIWVPTWLAEKEGITTLSDALARPELFPGSEDESRGAWFTCPSGWGCQAITNNQFIGSKAEEAGFDLIDSGSAAGLDGSISKAFNREQGWLGYYWAPTSILGKYDMTLLDLEAEHNPETWSCMTDIDCADPEVNAWPVSDVFTVVTEDFAEKAGIAMDYVQTRSWSNDTVSHMLAWMADNQASNEDGAYEFLTEHDDIWSTWVSEDVAEKVREAL